MKNAFLTMRTVFLVAFFLYCCKFTVGNRINCPSKSDKVVICYYASWSVYRENLGYFNLSNINTSLCTHLVYSFAGLNLDSKITPLDPQHDITNGAYKGFTQLKEDNPCLKTLLAIGGWNEGSKKYSVMSYDHKSREAFADNVLRYLVAYDFDGLDIDWEYPTQRGGLDIDKQNFVELVKVLSGKLKIWNLMLTAAIPLSKEVIEKAYDVREISAHLDYIQLMAYDFTPGNSQVTGLSAPLENIQESVNYLLDSGVPPSKLILGVATYARSFTLADPTETGIGVKTIGPGPEGLYTKEPGYISFYELLGKIESESYNVIYTTSNTYYAYRGVEWLTFDLEDSYAIKVKYALEKNLKGIMLWTIDTDDFHGVSGDAFPVLTTVNHVLNRIK